MMHPWSRPTSTRTSPVIVCAGLMLAVILAPLVLSGCGASQREKTLRATFVTINSSRDGFTTFDAQHQQRIVTDAKTLEEGQAVLASYRKDRERVLALFEGIYHALAAAVLGNDAKTMTAVLETSGQLKKALDDLRKAAAP